jgi:endonuclease-3 related protein
MIVGAILTQNTAWTNVEKAIANLLREHALTIEGIRNTERSDLERMVRPAGYFRQKAFRLKGFVAWLDQHYAGSLKKMFKTPTRDLRKHLLDLHGIGPETADSILLYAGQHEIFVVDAYTRRVFERHKLIRRQAKYDEIRNLVETALPAPRPDPAPRVDVSQFTSVERGPGPAEEVLTPVVHAPSRMSEAPRSQLAQQYNEFHALIVQTAKHYCHSRVARCEGCPLRRFLDGPVRVRVGRKASRKRK